MTLAYAQVLQYWVEEANLLASSEPHPLAMCIYKLQLHMGKHTTFHNCDVFKGLASALPRAMVEETQPSPMGTPPANDLTCSSSTSKAEVEEDTQPSPMGTPLVDDPTILSTVPEAQIEEDLLATWSTSPANLREDSVALTTILVDQLANPPTPLSSMGNEGKEYAEWIKVHSSHTAAAVESIPHNPSSTTTAALGGRKELVTSWRRSGGTLEMFLSLPHLKAPWT